MLSQAEVSDFLEIGYVIRRGALNADEIDRLRNAVDRVLDEARPPSDYGDVRYIDGDKDDIWGVNNIFHPSVQQWELVESLGWPQILEAIRKLIGPRLRYHLCTLLVNPVKKSYDLKWHRDSAFDGEISTERLLEGLQSGVQLNGALYEDESFVIVPGSHRREITDAERRVIREEPLGEMPGQMVVDLAPGDIVFYNSSLLHRGKTDAGQTRQTLHYAVVPAPPDGTPPNPDSPTNQKWLDNPDFPNQLPDALKPLFDDWRKYG